MISFDEFRDLFSDKVLEQYAANKKNVNFTVEKSSFGYYKVVTTSGNVLMTGFSSRTHAKEWGIRHGMLPVVTDEEVMEILGGWER